MIKRLYTKHWSISIWEGENPFHLRPLLAQDTALLTGAEVHDVDSESVADPFLLFQEGKWYLYYEVVLKKSGKGEIGLASSDDLVNWKYHQIVLREPFHLSYPQVFRHQGDFYMVPESRMAGEVRLYRCTSFPDRWELDSVLLEGDLADATVFMFQDRWYMFVLEGVDNFHIYHADRLHGPWQAHAQNPIVESDLSHSRPGGRVLQFEGELYRIVQDGFPVYGTQVRAFKVLKLSPQEFEEEQVADSPILKQQRRGWAGSGMHHMDAHQLPNGRWIAAVDGREIRFNLLNTR